MTDEKNMTLKLENREVLTVDRTEDVLSFSESKVVLKTADGALTISGRSLQIKKFGSEDFAIITGRIDSLSFSESVKSGRALLSKMIK